MSYRFIYGGSGAGKSEALYKEIIDRAQTAMKSGADASGASNFIIVVPDQYCMATQKILIDKSPSHGIMNIDVVGFHRLAHRVFEEVGIKERPILDDMGKTLVLRKLAGKIAPQLPVIGAHLKKNGYIAEVKSAISEFMQYGIGVDEMNQLIQFADGRGSLVARLQDLQSLYRAFMEYKKDTYATTEETLDLFAEVIPQSKILARSVVVFDGFTGFTPVQNRTIAVLMQYVKEVIITLALEEDGGLSPEECMSKQTAGEEDALFYLSRKTIRDLSRLAAEREIPHGQDIDLRGNTPRFANNPVLSHLEKQLFHYPIEPYQGESDAIQIMEATSIEQEVRQMGIAIRKNIETKGYCFRDFAVVAGDLSTYEEAIKKECTLLGIPVYLDTTRNVRHNPLTEGIRGALEVVRTEYGYEQVFHYLRSGLSGVSTEDCDLLENYVLAHGIRGKRRWETAFSVEVEEARQQFLAELEPFRKLKENHHGTAATVGEWTAALAAFLENLHAQEIMEGYRRDFEKAGEDELALTYGQMYIAVVDLLDQMYSLLPDETTSVRDYLELVETGISEIRLGTLPQKVDRVLVGDMERTRLSEVEVLFVLGANDGNIPKSASKGGILSDLDREFLAESGMELSPTPRLKMYTQRLYLYLNMTKPTDQLIISFAHVTEDGKSLRPSYLVAQLRKLFPQSKLSMPELSSLENQLVGPADAMEVVSPLLCDYVRGTLPRELEGESDFLTLFGLLSGQEQMPLLRKAAFARYVPGALESKTALKLYGSEIYGSVSRLETSAGCMYKHFLKYGLKLLERKELTFETRDAGNIMHDCLYLLCKEMEADGGKGFEGISEEEIKQRVSKVLKEVLDQNEALRCEQTARNLGYENRMRRVLLESVKNLLHQLEAGAFTPYAFELPFGHRDNLLPEFALDLGNGRNMALNGRIDRVDLAQKEDATYIKILDYKTGKKSLDLDNIGAGLQLQLMVYMQAVRLLIQKTSDKKPVPAGLLYSQFQDPILKAGASDLESFRYKNERPDGLLNADPEVLSLFAGEGYRLEEVVPARLTKEGRAMASGKLLSDEEFDLLSEQCTKAMKYLGNEILNGNIARTPVRDSKHKQDACEYCDYKEVCGLDRKIYGTEPVSVETVKAAVQEQSKVQK